MEMLVPDLKKLIKHYRAIAFGAFGLICVSSVQADPVDLNDWSVEEASPGNGTWTVAADGSEVVQSVNGNPTSFISNFNAQGSLFVGNIRVAPSSDNDYIGFLLGINPGDTTSLAADYLLIDWKQGDQFHDFGGNLTPGSTAERGLAVSRVTGIPTTDELWGHLELGNADSVGTVTELQRGTNLHDTGWLASTDYEFTFDFGPANLEVFVNGVLELDIAGLFSDGRFGFYNFSHANVTYSGFTEDVGSFPPSDIPAVPVPAAFWLFGTALIGFIGVSRRRKVA